MTPNIVAHKHWNMIRWSYSHRDIYELMRNFIILGMLWLIQQKSALLIGQDESLPWRFYFLLKNHPFEKGDYVGITNHETKYLKGIHFTKRVVGLPSDSIHIRNNRIYINKTCIGSLQPFTRRNKPLTPIKTGMIPKGFVFVATAHPLSFDSRYTEFGLVPMDKIHGKVIPII